MEATVEATGYTAVLDGACNPVSTVNHFFFKGQ
jgi:hypothetical protein